MKSIEEFYRQTLASAACTSSSSGHGPALPEPVRQAANRGWYIFPYTQLSILAGNPELLIAEATSDVDALKELAAKYPGCDWRVAVGASSLCILQLCGPQGQNSFAALSHEQGECLTLQSRRGDFAWGFFLWPRGLVLRKPAKELAPGMRILGRNDSCVIPPSGGSFYVNPWADPEAVPGWLRELAFETPNAPAASALPAFARSPKPHACRSRMHFQEPRTGVEKDHPFRGGAGRHAGFRISCRR